MGRTCAFGKAIKTRLIEMEKSQDWLIQQVQGKTGLYFDKGYMWKINAGVVATPSIVQAIEDILDIKYERSQP